MNELDILELFYDEMKSQGVTREAIFLSIEDQAAAMLSAKLRKTISVEDAQKLAAVCIANEWLERTTADVYFKYLSLTEAGLQIVLAKEYEGKAK